MPGRDGSRLASGHAGRADAGQRHMTGGLGRRPALTATLTGPAGHVYSIAFSPDGRVLAAASNDGTVHLWDTSPAAALAGICADAGQQLTRGEWATYVPGLTYRAPC